MNHPLTPLAQAIRKAEIWTEDREDTDGVVLPVGDIKLLAAHAKHPKSPRPLRTRVSPSFEWLAYCNGFFNGAVVIEVIHLPEIFWSGAFAIVGVTLAAFGVASWWRSEAQ